MTVATSPFADALRLHPGPDGHAVATLGPAFDGPGGPSGGLLAALALAAAAEHTPWSPRTLTMHFLRRAHAGPIELRVHPLHAGRSTAFHAVELRQDGGVFASASGAWAADRPAGDAWPHPAPAVPPPGDVASVTLPSPPAPPVLGHLDFRPLFGPPPFTRADAALTGGWMRLRESGDLTLPALGFFADAWWPAAFGRAAGPHDVPTLELTLHVHALPLPDDGPWVLARFTSPVAGDGFLAEDGELWAADGRLLVRSRQLARMGRPFSAGGT